MLSTLSILRGSFDYPAVTLASKQHSRAEGSSLNIRELIFNYFIVIKSYPINSIITVAHTSAVWHSLRQTWQSIVVFFKYSSTERISVTKFQEAFFGFIQLKAVFYFDRSFHGYMNILQAVGTLVEELQYCMAEISLELLFLETCQFYLTEKKKKKKLLGVSSFHSYCLTSQPKVRSVEIFFKSMQNSMNWH